LKQTEPEGKKTLLVLLLAAAVRYQADSAIPPFDDIYHLLRIESGIGVFDPGRGLAGAFCPWPFLYDSVLRLWPFDLTHLAPLFFALFCAVVAWRWGSIAGATAAVSPYLIGVSRSGALDHHFVEPPLVLLILVCAARRQQLLLALAITLALLIQPALIVAAGFAFLALFLDRERGTAFFFAAAAIAAYRLLQPDGYPDTAWFLGFPHALALVGAGVACELRRWASAPVALAAGASIALSSPALLQGLRFFGGDPWLETIVEFQPMFRDPSRIGTDIANLTGGAVLALTHWKRHRTFTIFAVGYLLLALSSRRFLVPAIPLFAIGGAMAVAYATTKWRAIAFAAMTLLPPLIYTLTTHAPPDHEHFRRVGLSFRDLPPGRVLAPWSYGHAIHVLGRKPVVIDNFGSMPDPVLFHEATQALEIMSDKTLLRWCRQRGIRYVWRPHR
jgi:hypothetical protein